MPYQIIWRDNGYPVDECHEDTWERAVHVARKWTPSHLSIEDIARLKAGDQVVSGDCETVEIREVGAL